MEPFTQRLWADQNRHVGDRFRLFSAVRDAVGGDRALYPGSFVDVAASAVFPEVTYVDIDKRASRFFEDEAGVAEIIESMDGGRNHRVEFLHRDYREDLPFAQESFEVLVSLYAGFSTSSQTSPVSGWSSPWSSTCRKSWDESPYLGYESDQYRGATGMGEGSSGGQG